MPADEQTITRLRAVDPAAELEAGLRLDSPGGRETLARVLAELERAPVRQPRRPLRLGVALAGAAGVAVAAALALTAGPGKPLGAVPAAGALHELAIAARAHRDSDPPLRPGQYHYERTEGFGLREEWVSGDGVAFAGGQEFEGIERLGYLGGGPGIYANFGDARLSYDEALALPRDPDRLYAFMASHTPVEADDPGALPQSKAMFFLLREFLITTPLPADLRAAFYDAAARIPGIELLGEVQAENGRFGLGIGMWRSGGPDDPNPPQTADGLPITQREDLIFDPQTGAIIGDRVVVRGNLHGESVVESGIVDRVGERPGESVPLHRIERRLERGRIAREHDSSSGE